MRIIEYLYSWIIHSSGVNSTLKPRRALSVSFMDARTVLETVSLTQFTGGELKSSGYPEVGSSSIVSSLVAVNAIGAGRDRGGL